MIVQSAFSKFILHSPTMQLYVSENGYDKVKRKVISRGDSKRELNMLDIKIMYQSTPGLGDYKTPGNH